MDQASLSVLERLRAGHTLTGMQCFSGSAVLVEIMGSAGLDFVTLDMEHTALGLENMAHLLRSAEASGIVPFARVNELNASLVGRVLDLGVKGVVLPHASPERCRQVLDYARYAPQGSRGACPNVRGAGYAPADWRAFAEASNRDTLVIPLVEDAAAVEEIDGIMSIDGIDAVFLGPFDLSISLGYPSSDLRQPGLRKVLDKVVASARRHGKFVMTSVATDHSDEYANFLIDSGVRLLSFNVDVGVFFGACRRISQFGRGGEARAARLGGLRSGGEGQAEPGAGRRARRLRSGLTGSP